MADDEPVIDREGVVALLFAVNDLVEGIGEIAELLREDDDDGEDV